LPDAPLIAVTGASGIVGGAIAERLADAGARQRLVVRDARRAPAIAGAEVRGRGDYADYEGMLAALQGVDTLMLIPAAEHPHRVMQHASAVDAAVAAGVRRIVYLSYLGAEEYATFTLARQHWATEQHIRAAGTAFTFLRMSLYMDFIASMVGPDDVIRGPAGEGRVAPILRADVATACAALLLVGTDGRHDGATYDLTGRERLSLADAAAILGRHAGREIRYEDEPDDEALQSRASYGAPDWEVEGWVSSYQAIRDGSLDVVSRAFSELTGLEPATLEEHLRTTV
jgi:NAD(P)H dehydrogenase (quinone)